jgi:CRISPR system Cascade subunit CasB
MNTNLKKHQIRFIQYLEKCVQNDQRNVLATLRRGLGAPPGEDINMFPYVAKFIPDYERGKQEEKIYYLIASLFAYHQISCGEGNFGSHMRKSIENNNIEATERRFTVLLNAHINELPDYLRQSVSYLKSKEEPIHWYSLFDDLNYWTHPNKFVQKKWANSFWGYKKEEQE